MRKTHWHQAIDEAINRFRKPTHDEIIDIAKELFPQEMEAGSNTAELRGFKASIRDAMRQMFNIDESRSDMDIQTILPGMTAPSYIGVSGKNTGETSPVKYIDSRPSERREAIDQRKLVIRRIQKRVRDMQDKEDFLNPHISHEFEKLEATLKKISEQEKSA